MTEADWLAATDPTPMLGFLRDKVSARMLLMTGSNPSARKWRLIGVACCRRVWEAITEDECRRVVDAVEQFADGEISEMQLQCVADAAVECGYRVHHDARLHRAYSATDALGRGVGLGASLEHSCSCAVSHTAYTTGRDRTSEMHAQSALIRDIFGSPFRSVAFDPAWQSETAVALATGIYTERAFDRMPILADALEEAGCDDVDVLAHCRGPGPHVRGCWVVDRVLGKE